MDAKKVPVGKGGSRVKRYAQGTSLPTTGTNNNIPASNQNVKKNHEAFASQTGSAALCFFMRHFSLRY